MSVENGNRIKIHTILSLIKLLLSNFSYLQVCAWKLLLIPFQSILLDFHSNYKNVHNKRITPIAMVKMHCNSVLMGVILRVYCQSQLMSIQ